MASFKINALETKELRARVVADPHLYFVTDNPDGVALASMAHPRPVWYARPYWAIRCLWQSFKWRFF